MPYLITTDSRTAAEKVKKLISCRVLEFEDITEEIEDNHTGRDFNQLRRSILRNIIDCQGDQEILNRYQAKYSEDLIYALIEDIYKHSHHVVNRRRKRKGEK